MVNETVVLLVRRDHAATHVTGWGQRAGQVDFGAILVPRAHSSGDVAFELFSRAFAHQIDGGRRVSRAGHQASRTAQHFDTVVDGHVRKALRRHLRCDIQRRRNAIELVIIYRVPT
ncbi:hypothetical protein D3C72_2112490 [compost metagenome]